MRLAALQCALVEAGAVRREELRRNGQRTEDEMFLLFGGYVLGDLL